MPSKKRAFYHSLAAAGRPLLDTLDELVGEQEQEAALESGFPFVRFAGEPSPPRRFFLVFDLERLEWVVA